MKIVYFVAILFVLSACTLPFNPWPEEPTSPPNLMVTAPERVLVHEPFRITTIPSSTSSSPKPISLEWRWLKGEATYELDENLLISDGITSLESARFYSADGIGHDMTISLQVKEDKSTTFSNEDISYALSIYFSPPLKRSKEMVFVDDLFGKSYLVGNLNDELVLLGINNERTVEIPNMFSLWSKGNLVRGNILGYKKEIVDIICSDKNQATIGINGQFRRVIEGQSYSYGMGSDRIIYSPSLISFTTIPVETGLVVFDFGEDDDVLSLRVEAGETKFMFVSGVELEVTVYNVGCVPSEQNIIPAEISIGFDNKVSNLSVGDYISSNRDTILFYDFYYYEMPVEGAAARLMFNPEKIVFRQDGAYRGTLLSSSSELYRIPVSSDLLIQSNDGAIAGVIINYAKSSILKDFVFDSFSLEYDNDLRMLKVKDTATVTTINKKENEWNAYFNRRGTYTFEVTATENGISTTRDIIIVVE